MTEVTRATSDDVAGYTRRHPVQAFLLGVTVLSGAVFTVALLVKYERLPGGSLPARVGLDLEEATSFLLVLSLFVVTLAVTAAEGGREATVGLLRRMTRWNVAIRWWLAVVVGLPLGTVVIAVCLGDSAHTPSARTVALEVGSLLVAVALINTFEESAWTGFLQTHLERQHNFFVSAAITAVPFSLVHLPIRVVSGESTTPAEIGGSFVALMVFTPVIRVLFGAVARGAGNSVLLAAVTHTMFNRSNNADGLAADILTGGSRQGAALLAMALLTVAVVLVLGRHGVSRERRLELDSSEGRRVSVTPGGEDADRSDRR